MADSKISALPASTTPLAGTEVLPVVQSSTTKQVSVANLTAGRAVSAASLALTTPLPTTSGGTGLASFSANQVLFASSTSAVGQSANFTWDGTSLVAGGTSNSTAGITVRQSNSNNGIFRLGQTGKNYAILGGDYQGAMELYTEAGAGDILFTVAGTNRGRMNSSGFKPIAGNGIDYSANTGAAGKTSQLLNWYEEGTWTPNQGAGLTVVGAFSSAGRYTRVGRLVTVTGYVQGATSIAVSSGNALTTNLPFTTGFNGIGTMIANNQSVGGQIVAATTTIYTTGMTAVSAIYFTVTYSV